MLFIGNYAIDLYNIVKNQSFLRQECKKTNMVHEQYLKAYVLVPSYIDYTNLE